MRPQWVYGRPLRQARVTRLLSPVMFVNKMRPSHAEVYLGAKRTRDILLGIVMITEYPLSVVFSTCSRKRERVFDLDRASHRQSDT